MALTLNWRVWTIVGAVALALFLVLSIAFFFRSLFITFVVGGVSIILVDRFRKTDGSKKKNKLVVLSTIIFWVLLLVIGLYISIEQLSMVFADLGAQDRVLPEVILERVGGYIPETIQSYILAPDNLVLIEDYVIQVFSTLLQALGGFFAQAIIIIPLLFYLYFKHGSDMKKALVKAIPKEIHAPARKATSRIREKMEDFTIAKVVQSIIVGGICCFGFYCAGLNGWLFLGLLAGILNIVPYLGPILGGIPPLFVALLADFWMVVFVLITIGVAQLVDNLYLQPFMIADRVSINPLTSIVLVFVGAQLLGALGMLLSIPIYMVCAIILVEVYKESARVLDKKR